MFLPVPLETLSTFHRGRKPIRTFLLSLHATSVALNHFRDISVSTISRENPSERTAKFCINVRYDCQCARVLGKSVEPNPVIKPDRTKTRFHDPTRFSVTPLTRPAPQSRMTARQNASLDVPLVHQATGAPYRKPCVRRPSDLVFR
jgi:hypothetical protein